MTLTTDFLLDSLPNCIDTTNYSELGEHYPGKVRDVYIQPDKLMLIVSDRVSAFDRILGLIPYKGQVLNQISSWWFEQTADIVPNHVINVVDPNVIVAKKAEIVPIEVVVRGYITGVTDTSLWQMYANGDRTPYGIPMPDGLQKNDPLPEPIITPTTKAPQGQHDEKITEAEIIDRGIVAPELWAEITDVAIALFKRGQVLAAEKGLILVDTKYEFGVIDGQLVLCDEIHTPDSSRYWLAETYDEKRTPENFSKEFLRKWYAKQGYTGDGTPPVMPDEFRVEVAERYISIFEQLTGQTFVPGKQPAIDRISTNLTQYKL